MRRDAVPAHHEKQVRLLLRIDGPPTCFTLAQAVKAVLHRTEGISHGCGSRSPDQIRDRRTTRKHTGLPRSWRRKEYSRIESAVLQTTVATSPEQIDYLWQLENRPCQDYIWIERKRSADRLYRGCRVCRLARFAGILSRHVQDILQEHEVTASYLVHAGGGPGPYPALPGSAKT